MAGGVGAVRWQAWRVGCDPVITLEYRARNLILGARQMGSKGGTRGQGHRAGARGRLRRLRAPRPAMRGNQLLGRKGWPLDGRSACWTALARSIKRGMSQASAIPSVPLGRQRNRAKGEARMSDNDPVLDPIEGLWHARKVTRRRLIGYGVATAGALGATLAVPAPWRAAFGQAKPYKIGTLQPLSGVAAAGGKTSLVGVQMAIDRINKAGGINGRPVELIVADDESKPDVGRRKVEKLLVEDKIDAHAGGYLSNVCLACMPSYEEAKVVNMITVCLDTTITTSKCSRYTFRPFDYAPAQAVAIAPYLINKLGKKWHIAYLDYSWGQSTRDAYTEQIRKNGGDVVGTTGIPLGTADMTAFLSKITGEFDGIFGILFGAPAVTFLSQAYDLGLSKKYKMAGDGAMVEATHLPALGHKAEGFVGVNR